MLLNKETAVGGLVQELNRWLKVKWLHADYNKQLPNARDVLDYFKRLFESAEREYGGAVCNAHADFYKELGKEQPDQCCDFDTLTLLDTSVQGNDLVLFTWLGGEQMTVQHLIPERSSWGGNYSPRWDNVRGRGDRNRTHDCHVDDCKIYPANLVEYDEPVSKTRFKRLVPPGYFELQKNPDAKPTWREFVEYTDRYEPLHNEDGSEVPPDEQDQIIDVFDYRRQHVYVSVPKMFSYADARSNFELQPEEYINLTYLNSVWLEWAVTTKNLGGWTVGSKEVTYAYAIKYIKTALDFIRKREAEEKANLDAVDSTITQDPDWPLRLSEWKLAKGVRQITPYQAKRFAKYYKERGVVSNGAG